MRISKTADEIIIISWTWDVLTPRRCHRDFRERYPRVVRISVVIGFMGASC
jgi:hypothetical protein